MRIGITGVPGTGKTSISNILGCLLNIPVVHEAELFRGSVDLRAYRLKLLPKLRRDVILEGHLLCEARLPLDVVIVLRTRPDVLVERLRARGYPERKVWENVLAEALDYCLIKAKERYEEVWQLDTTSRRPEECARIIAQALKEGKGIFERVDWSPILEEMLKRGEVQI